MGIKSGNWRRLGIKEGGDSDKGGIQWRWLLKIDCGSIMICHIFFFLLSDNFKYLTFVCNFSVFCYVALIL